jgi:hypothetical protein
MSLLFTAKLLEVMQLGNYVLLVFYIIMHNIVQCIIRAHGFTHVFHFAICQHIQYYGGPFIE